MALGVTLTPLIAAVITAVVRVDRLAEEYRASVLQAETATEQGRSLDQNLTEMRRALGQYRVVREENFYQTYLERREAFRNAADNLTGLELSEAANAELRALLRDEQALFERIGGDSGSVTASAADAEWSALTARARNVLTASSNLITDEANFALREAAGLQRDLLLLAAAVIPVTLILGGFFVVSINRLMRGLSTAIRGLGAHDLSEAIRIRGPRDIEELGEQLDWLRRRLTELEHQKVTFLRHISHELKTPLTTLREGSELLSETLADSSPEDAEVAKLMQSSSVRLQKLIENLLQVGKQQEPFASLSPEPGVRLDRLVEDTITEQSVAYSAKGVEIRTDLEEVELTADAGKLGIVIDNLVTNAIKYTPSGGRVRIGLARSGEYACLDIHDTGPGVVDAESESIFEPFTQGSAPYQSSVKGTGLGLAIAKDYVESHDGRIELVESQAGAHFRITLPLDGPRPDARGG